MGSEKLSEDAFYEFIKPMFQASKSIPICFSDEWRKFFGWTITQTRRMGYRRVGFSWEHKSIGSQFVVPGLGPQEAGA